MSQQSVLLVFSLSILMPHQCSGFSEKYPSCSAVDTNQNCQAQNQNTKSQAMYSKKINVDPSWQVFIEAHQKAVQLYDIQNQGDKFPYTSTIENDLAIFKKNGISRDLLRKCREQDRQAVTYQAIDGKLYRSRDCLFPARCEGVEYFLLRAIQEKKKLKVPDFELVMNVHDWPIGNRHFGIDPLPTFSFSKTPDYTDIYFPAWTFWAGGPAITLHPRGLGKWAQISQSLLASGKSNPWSTKQDKAFFRGSRTSSERDPLILLSRRLPELVDAKYTKNQSWKSKKDTLGEEPASEVSLEDHCQFKYLFNYRGVAASFRFKHLFLCGSTVIHVGSEWTEFFYPSMVPWFHYIPLSESQNNQDDIRELLHFLRENADIASSIARNGQTFIEKHLRIKDVHKYWRVLLKKYSKLLDFKPTKNLGFIEIKNK